MAALIYGLVASSTEDRKIGAIFLVLVVMLGSFVAVVDAARVVLREAFFGADFILGMVEDGGEMLMVALTLSAALLLFRHLADLHRPSRRGVRSR